MRKTDSKTALVLGSGGARGLAHIGVIKVLEENKIPIHLITGTSIGAMVGGLYATGIDVKSMENIVKEVDKIMVAKILMPKLFAPGIFDNNRILEFIEELIGDVKIEDLKIPFAAVATDLITGEQVVFNKGPLLEAIMSSIAIPTILQPVFLNNRYLIDGGLSNPLPISVAVQMGVQKIIAVNVSPDPGRITKKIKRKKTEEVKLLLKKLPTLFANLINEQMKLNGKSVQVKKSKEKNNPPMFSPSIFNVFLQSISISTNNLIMQHLRCDKPDVLISPNVVDFDMLEFHKGSEIIQRGYDAGLKSLSEIK